MKILYFSPVKWTWIKQRPHFIAEVLASGNNELLFCSRSPLGKGAFFTETRQISERLTVRDYVVLPLALRFPIIEKWNSFYLKKRLFKEHFDAIVLTDPRLVDILPDQKEFAAPVIYECMDRYSFFYEGTVRERILQKEQQLCRRADAIITSSDVLKSVLMETCSVPPEKIHVIRNAAADHLLDSPADSATDPVDLLYAGTVDHWFDWEVIISFAKRFPARKIRIVGPARNIPETLPENIEMYGTVPHSEIPHLLRNASILLIPFLPNDLIQAVDPVKLYEYLSLGKHVISSYWKELDYFRDQPRLHFYRNAEEFISHAEKILTIPMESSPDKTFLAENCWSKRGKEFYEILESLIRK